MRRALVVVLLALGLLSAACGGSGTSVDLSADHGYHGAYLDQPYVVPDVALSDTGGSSYSLAKSSRTELQLVFFGYTHCPDTCQVVMSTIASAVTKLSPADRKKVQVVFVTTDPQRDTEGALRTYLDRFNPSFQGLTGPVDRLDALGRPMRIFVKQGAKLPDGGYDVTHSTQVMAVQHAAVPVLWTLGVSPSQMADDLTKLLRG